MAASVCQLLEFAIHNGNKSVYDFGTLLELFYCISVKKQNLSFVSEKRVRCTSTVIGFFFFQIIKFRDNTVKGDKTRG